MRTHLLGMFRSPNLIMVSNKTIQIGESKGGLIKKFLPEDTDDLPRFNSPRRMHLSYAASLMALMDKGFHATKVETYAIAHHIQCLFFWAQDHLTSQHSPSFL